MNLKRVNLKESEVVAQDERVQPIVKAPPQFPHKYNKHKEDECFGKFLSNKFTLTCCWSMFLQRIPRYVMEIVANKRRLIEYETVALTKSATP